eukprot:gene343-976_t
MGQVGSSRHKTLDLSKSDSTLEFEPGKKLAAPQGGPNQAPERTAPYEKEIRKIPSILSDEDEEEARAHRGRRKLTVPTVFRWEYGGKEVYLSGSFNEWKTRIPMSYSGGEFNAIIELLEGEHQFKFLVDGHWIHDPNQPTVNDTYGGRNNVVMIKKSDFDAGEALDVDAGQQKGSFGSLRQSSPPGSYGQLVPSPNTPVVIHDSLHSSVPPMLPPHLLNVILNKDAIDQEDPTLLPVPHHVALNHLYALSIKDGVMTLSATHRYRRKYVTTVFYKPVK